MKKTSTLLLVSALAAALTMTGCTQNEENLALAGAGVAAVAVAANSYHSDGSHTGNYYHNNYDYGSGRNYSYRDGVRAGCESRRSWRQDYYRYQNDYNYKSGWQAGYRQCRY
jgi:hypothetical protein